MKTNNSANINSQAAKKAGLSYWEYMEKTYSGCVQKFVWGAKKETRKEKREAMPGLEHMLDRSNLPGMKMLSHMRNLIGGRVTYRRWSA